MQYDIKIKNDLFYIQRKKTKIKQVYTKNRLIRHIIFQHVNLLRLMSTFFYFFLNFLIYCLLSLSLLFVLLFYCLLSFVLALCSLFYCLLSFVLVLGSIVFRLGSWLLVLGSIVFYLSSWFYCLLSWLFVLCS